MCHRRARLNPIIIIVSMFVALAYHKHTWVLLVVFYTQPDRESDIMNLSLHQLTQEIIVTQFIFQPNDACDLLDLDLFFAVFIELQ